MSAVDSAGEEHVRTPITLCRPFKLSPGQPERVPVVAVIFDNFEKPLRIDPVGEELPGVLYLSPNNYVLTLRMLSDDSEALPVRLLIEGIGNTWTVRSAPELVRAAKFDEEGVVESSRKVFVVHGHDEGAREAVARFLEKLGLEAIILNEQPDQGRTIIEKFEACASEGGFAVVLLTPDDLASGAAAESVQASRARQNVIFELGYFAGKLGRGRACLLRTGEVEIPSDLYGVIYTEMDRADGWKLKLVRELKAAQLDFDTSKMWA